MSLQGQLCDMSFHDLFDVLTKDSQQGRLNLEKGHYRAQLFVEKGEPYAARVLRVSGQHQEIWLRGEEAVHHMSAWEEGQFSFEHQAILPTARNIFIDKRELMLANIFKQDLYSQLQPDSTPTRRPAFDFAALSRQYVHALPGYRSRASQLDLNVTDWAILIQVDGAVSITQMAQAAHLSPEVTWHGVSKMVKLGLLALYQPASLVTLPPPITTPRDNPPPNPVNRSSPAYANWSYTGGMAALATANSTAASNSGYSVSPSQTHSQPAPRQGLLSSLMAKIRSL